MRYILLAGVLVACSVLSAAPIPKEKGKPVKDDDAIQGMWRVEKYEGTDGPPPDEVAKARIVFGDGKVTTLMAGAPEDNPLPYTLDPTAKPKAIDFTEKAGVLAGIYELDGDTLRLCMAKGTGMARPTEMKAVGKEVAFMILKRVDDEKKGK